MADEFICDIPEVRHFIGKAKEIVARTTSVGEVAPFRTGYSNKDCEAER